MAMADNLEKMLASGRDDPMLRFGLGSAYFNDGELARAVPHLEACIAQDASYTAAYKLLGKALIGLGQLEEAEVVLKVGLERSLTAGDKQTEKEVRVYLKKIEKENSRG